MDKKKGKPEEDPKKDNFPVYFDNTPVPDSFPVSDDTYPKGLLFVP
jgi:hypothetical protein